MKFRRGRYRFVFIFPSLGIAIKLPIIHFFLALNPELIKVAKGISKLRYLKMYLSYPIEYVGSFKGFLFGGLYDNWNEFYFYWKTKNVFLQPTYFSFFGLFNIQKTSEPCLLKKADFWLQLRKLTNDKVYDDPHHFENPDNYCFDNGRLKILDYGSKRTHKVIAQYGTKILESFDPSCDWEEKKKAIVAQKTN